MSRFLGVLLVLGSAALGGWLFSTTRDSTDYWMVRDDVRVGDRVVDDSVANRMSALQESLRR